MLEDYGATVTALATADEALELLERERPDVLVSALAMPDKGGYWLIGPGSRPSARARWRDAGRRSHGVRRS